MDAPKIASAAIVVLGIIIVGVGWHAYFESSWNKQMLNSSANQDDCKQAAKALGETCPSLALEQLFIAIAVITLLISVALLIGGLLLRNDAIKRLTPLYNIGAAVLLFIGGILVIVSAVQINSLRKAAVQSISIPRILIRFEYHRNDGQYYDEKIAAGALSFIAAILYGAAALLGFKSSQNRRS